MGFIILEIIFKRAWFHSERPNLCLCSSPRLPPLYRSFSLMYLGKECLVQHLISYPFLQVFLENRKWMSWARWVKNWPSHLPDLTSQLYSCIWKQSPTSWGSGMGFLIYIPISRVTRCSSVLGTASVLAMKVLKRRETLSPEQTRTLGQHIISQHNISLCSSVSIYTVIRILVTAGCPHSMWTSRRRELCQALKNLLTAWRSFRENRGICTWVNELISLIRLLMVLRGSLIIFLAWQGNRKVPFAQ